MPLLRTTMYSRALSFTERLLRTRATVAGDCSAYCSGGPLCSLLQSAQRRRDFPGDYHAAFGNDPDTVICRGGSCIVDPFGNFLAGPNTEGEAFLRRKLTSSKSSAESMISM